jgi:hypothetical protein
MQRHNQVKGGRHAQGEICEARDRGRLQRPPLLTSTLAETPFSPVVKGLLSSLWQRGSKGVWLARPFLVILAFLSLVASHPNASAHGGPPLRVGVTGDPQLAAVGRVALVHLREGVGFAVVWQEYADEVSLRAALAAGKVDVAVAMPDPGDAPPGAPGGECTAAQLDRVRAALRARWGAEVYPLGFALGAAPCVRPALVVARGVLEDLRFGILGKEAARLAAGVTAADVAGVRAAEERGGERAAVAAARAALAAKAWR